jgi:hypothetical protein
MSDATKKTRKPKVVTPAQAAKIEGAFEAAMAAKRAQETLEAFGGTQVATEPPKPRGRPSKWTQEIEDEICERLSRGEPLRAICRLEGFPEWTTVYGWMERRDGFSERVARARENGVEAIAQDTLAMIDAPPQVVVDNNGVSRIDPAYVQWTKLRTEQRMKLLACWSPNRYGNRVQVAGDKENPLQVNIQTSEMFESILKNAEMTRQIDVE